MDLRNSIGRVSSASGSNAFAGTAFLFSDQQHSQLWLTCHHVIRDLPSLRLLCHASDSPYPLECEYRADLSAPQMDIAILESRLTRHEMDSLKLSPLPIGAPPSDSNDMRLIGCGFSRDAQTHPRGINFVGRFSTFQYLAIPNDDDPTRVSILEKGQSWNIPFEEKCQVDLYEFRDEGARVEKGFSGSPICIEIDSTSGSKMCIGMLSTRRMTPNALPTHGFVIPYGQIKAACPDALPFHAYADYVVVVLAAKRFEFEELRAQLEVEDLKNRSDHYDNQSRDEWRPFTFGDPTIKALISEASGTSRSWQLSSEYLDRTDEAFQEYLANRGAGALVFIIDRNSLAAPSLRKFLTLAKDHNRDACYVFPLCEEMRVLSRGVIERQLQDAFPQLWGRWHRDRVKLSWDCDDFSERFRNLLDRAWELYIHENRSYPRRRIGEAAGAAATTSRMDWSAH